MLNVRISALRPEYILHRMFYFMAQQEWIEPLLFIADVFKDTQRSPMAIRRWYPPMGAVPDWAIMLAC